MAVAPDIYSGKQWELAISQEDTWGTPQTTGFKSLHIETAQPVDRSGLTHIYRKRARGNRMPHNTDYTFIQGGGMVNLPFEAWATHDTLDLLVHAVMHDLVSEGVSTPFAKIWEWDSGTTSPLFNTVAAITTRGTIFSVIQGGPVASEQDLLVSAILSQLTFNKSIGQPLVVSGNWFSGHSGAYDQSNNTDITSATDPGTDYYVTEIVKQIGGVDVILGDYSFTLDPKAARQGNDANGNAENYVILGGDDPFLSGSLNVMYDTNTKDLIDNAMTTGFDTQLIIAYGSGNDPVDTDGDLLIKLNIHIDPTAIAKDYGREEGVMWTIPFTGADDGTNEMVEIEVANAVDRAWTV